MLQHSSISPVGGGGDINIIMMLVDMKELVGNVLRLNIKDSMEERGGISISFEPWKTCSKGEAG